MPLRLEITEGQEPKKVFLIPDDENRIIGRSVHADITLDDPLISRKHCRLEVSPGACQLIDLNSSNATRVNGRRVREVILGTGDQIRLGSHVLEATLETPDGEPIAPKKNLQFWLRRRSTWAIAALIGLNTVLLALLLILWTNNDARAPFAIRCPVSDCQPPDPEGSNFCATHGVPLIKFCNTCGQESSKSDPTCPHCRGMAGSQR